MITRIGLAIAALGLAPFLVGCSLGKGQGTVHSDKLYAADCWYDAYDLQPDFFAAVPFRQTLQIRVQRGNDLQEVSDGLDVLVDDLDSIRNDFLGQPLSVSLPVGSAPPGTPVGKSPLPTVGQPTGGAALVHMDLNLERSCHNANIVLSAISGTITFDHMFSGDPDESNASEKLTETAGVNDPSGLGGFDVMIADPRDIPEPGDPVEKIPLDKQTHLQGSFSFYFERGQPGQPFP